MIKFLDLYEQYTSIKHEIDGAIQRVIRDSAFVGGKYVEEFEAAFAEYHQARHCIGVANGTDALEIAIEALSLPPGSEVVVPANTFVATSEAVTRSGHRILFCDCDPSNYTLSPDDVARRMTSNTRAIVAVHLYGHPCDMDRLLEIARRHSLILIEDCAQAHGAEYKGRRVGTIGDVGTFSFYPGKNLGAYGDAGAIVTNDDRLAQRCRMTANHGRVGKYAHEFEGRNSRLDGMQAAILSVKLKHLDSWLARRAEVARGYNDHLGNLTELVVPRQETWAKHVWHLYVVRTSRRDQLQDYLHKRGVQTGVHYPCILPRLAAYNYMTNCDRNLIAGDLENQILSIPMGEHLRLEHVAEVASAIHSFFSD